MSDKKSIFLLITLGLMSLLLCISSATRGGDFGVRIAAVDPPVKSDLAIEDKVYLKVEYESELPLRFQASGVRDGSEQDVGAIKNMALLHPPGKGEALAWVMYLNITHIDSVRLTVYDEKWKELFRLSREIDVTWKKDINQPERRLAEWIKPLDRAEKRLTDFFYDPAPRRFGALYDAFFYINLGIIPVYIIMQSYMLYRYRYRWRELAMIPTFPYMIVGFYLLVGVDIERALLVSFLFRYTFAAFLWLMTLWLAKRFWQDKLPPPKLYTSPKD